MPDSIKPHRMVLDDRFSVMGFTIRTDAPTKWFEVALATEPSLFRADARNRRTAANFYSTRVAGPLLAERGEAVYLAPSEALGRFIGQPKLYFALATFHDSARNQVEIANLPAEGSPWIDIKSFTGRALRRTRGIASRRTANGNGYGTSNGAALEWAGDAVLPEMQPISNSPATGSPVNGSSGNGNRAAAPAVNGTTGAPANGSPAVASALSNGRIAVAYDDGFGDDFWARMQEAPEAPAQDADKGIEGPIPDEAAIAKAPQTQSYSFPFTTAEYPLASRFVAAASTNYRASSAPRAINRVVIHITDGGGNINGTISWFQNPDAKVSSHYIVGQDGEIVQMVEHNNVAWHARRANGDSIGIEHCANTRGLMPSEQQYCASAALVSWLCDQYGIPKDRQHILGHSEADTGTTHTGCPNAVWDWDYFMGLVTSGSCYPRTAASAQGLSRNQWTSAPATRQRPPAMARPQVYNIIRPLYQPSSPEEARRFMQEWQRRRERWRAGVPNTRFFPHSAICHFLIAGSNGKYYLGTGFYIGQNKILTCAHNLQGANSITITPGKNVDDEPGFPAFTVYPDSWAIHPNYQSNSSDYDLGVILVSTPPPNGQAFDILEELLQSQNSPIIVCGYAAEDGVDPDKQHLDGDAIRLLAGNMQTFQYNLQTTGGNSGSPVFYVTGYEDQQQQMSVAEIRVIGVHTAVPMVGPDQPNQFYNLGCRLTAEKIQWINSIGQSYPAGAGLGYARPLSNGHRATQPNGTAASYAPARSRAMSAESFSLNWDEIEVIPQPTNRSCWATAGAMIVGWRDRVSISPETIAEIAGRTTATGLNPNDRQQLANDLGLVTEPPQSYSIDGFRTLLENNGPLWVGVAVPSGHAIVVTGMYSDGAPDGSDTFIRITDPWDRDPGMPGAAGAYLNTHDTGSRYILTWQDFVREYENRLTVNATTGAVNIQIAHAGGTGGREPSRSGAQGYAMGYNSRSFAAESPARARGFSDPMPDAPAPSPPMLSLKEVDYSDVISEDEDLVRSEPTAAATLTNEEIYRIIREVVVADSGEANYTAVITDRDYQTNGAQPPRQFGLAFGLALFTQESGRLGSVLRLMQRRDAAVFAEAFGTDAEALLAVTNAATAAERLMPVGGEPLWSDTWIERFRSAGALPVCQAAQNEEAIEGQFRSILRIAGDLGLTTDRALGLAYDRVVTQGLGGALRWIMQSAGPLRTASQRSHALAILGHADLAQFQTAAGLPPSGRFTPATHAALAGALRRQGEVALPLAEELSWRLYVSSTGAAKQRLRRLLDSTSFTDVVYAI